jgi:hypothetical protein
MSEMTDVRRTGTGLQRVVPAALLAMGLSAVVWLLAVPVGGDDLRVGDGADAQTVALPSVLVVSAVAVFAGALTRRVLARRARGVLVWNVLAGVVLVLSLTGPLGAATAEAGLALTAMHLVVAAVVLAGQRWTAGPTRGGVA